MSDAHTLLPEIISAYRNMVIDRYEFNRIKTYYKVPDSINEEVYKDLKDYFLEYLYPSFAKRTELNQAFDQLDAYIKHPGRLLRIIKDSFGLLIKYGVHLPKILITGLKAMNSFKSANEFELELAQIAAKSRQEPPFSKQDMELFLSKIPRHRFESFIDNGVALFKVLYDKNLVKRILDIVDQIIQTMKAKPHVYSTQEIKALELGRTIIVNGQRLFERLSPDDQKFLFKSVEHLERATIAAIFDH